MGEPPHRTLRFSEIGDLPQEVNVRVEVVRGSFTKRKPDGSVDFVSPFPSPFNYGSIEGTVAEDGDPLDAILLGTRVRLDERVPGRVRAVLGFVDAGRLDPKVICAPQPLTDAQVLGIELFFSTYARMKRVLYVRRQVRGTTRRGEWLERLEI